MQIALHDIRRFGYIKIFNELCDSKFIESVKDFNNKIYNYDESSFSVLNKWEEMEPSLNEIYDGFVMLINSYTPMVTNVGVDIIAKRKIRNTWTKIWLNIKRSVLIDDDTINILSDCGIRLVHYLYDKKYNDKESVDEDVSKVLKLYNTLLKWSIFSEKELNFKKNNLDHLQVIEIMIINSDENFVDFILRNIK